MRDDHIVRNSTASTARNVHLIRFSLRLEVAFLWIEYDLQLRQEPLLVHRIIEAYMRLRT